VVVVQVVQVAQFRPAWAAQAADPAATQVEAVDGRCQRQPRWRQGRARASHGQPRWHIRGARRCPRRWQQRLTLARRGQRAAAGPQGLQLQFGPDCGEVRLDYPWPCWAPSSCWGDRAGVASDTTNHTRGDVLGVLDERDELHLSPATGASLDVKVESPAHQLAPRDVPTAVGGRSRRGVFVRWQASGMRVHPYLRRPLRVAVVEPPMASIWRGGQVPRRSGNCQNRVLALAKSGQSGKRHAIRQHARSKIVSVAFGRCLGARRGERDCDRPQRQAGRALGAHRTACGRPRLGVAKGRFKLPESIDADNPAVASLFSGEDG